MFHNKSIRASYLVRTSYPSNNGTINEVRA